MTIRSENDPPVDRHEDYYTIGYTFGKAYMHYQFKVRDMPIQVDRYYEYDKELFKLEILHKAGVMLLEEQEDSYYNASQFFPELIDGSVFKQFFYARAIPPFFQDNYTAMNFLNFLAWLSQCVIDLKDNRDSKDFSKEGIDAISDLLNVFILDMEFQLGGGWPSLFSTAEAITRESIRQHLERWRWLLRRFNPNRDINELLLIRDSE